MNRERALHFTRYNSGRRLLDSGDAYGRIYEHAPPPEGRLVYIHPRASGLYDAAISVTEMLVRCCEENEALNALWQEYSTASEERENQPWHKLVDEFLESLGYENTTRRDNTYNYDNDFDQAFTYALWSTPDARNSSEDLYYHREDDSGWGPNKDLPNRLCVFQIHTGCDVRSGYSEPLLCTGQFNEYSLPCYCPQIEFSVYPLQEDETGRSEEEKLVVEEVQDFMDCYGGSACTSYFLEKRGYVFESVAEDCSHFLVRKAGVLFKAWPSSSLEY